MYISISLLVHDVYLTHFCTFSWQHLYNTVLWLLLLLMIHPYVL